MTSTTLEPLRELPDRARADEQALVLVSSGISCATQRHGGRWWLLVAPDAHARARAVLEAWERENQDRGAAPLSGPDRGPTWAGVGAALALLGAYVWTGPAGPGALTRAGGGRAAALLGGDWWRALTALTLHVDLPHVAGNALAAAVFVTYLARRIGGGAALALCVASGALGNVANAVYHDGAHRWVGASTALFGAIGVLAGLEAVARWRRGAVTRRRAWMPLAAGLALLAMLGTGRGSDFGAHLCGIAAGALLGAAYEARIPGGPGRAGQIAAGTAAVLALAVAWLRALA